MKETKTVTVPRDNPENKGICRDVENTIFNLIAEHPEECYHTNELTQIVVSRFGKKYAGLGKYHVVRALDQFFANQLIKRVAPSLWQSVDGPDEPYSERASGFVPEELGYQPRPANYTECPTVPSARGRAIFNREMRDVEVSLNILFTIKGMTLEKAQLILLCESNRNPVAVKWAVKNRQTLTKSE